MEEWRDIIGYEGLYEISSFGTVRSYERIRNTPNGGIRVYPSKVKKAGMVKSGYLNVQLWKDGKANNKMVHLLVAEAFLSNPNNFPIINHKDECKTNPKLSNLEWCTYVYNRNYKKGVDCHYSI